MKYVPTRSRGRRIQDIQIPLTDKEIKSLRAILDSDSWKELESALIRKSQIVYVPVRTIARVLDAMPQSVKDHALFAILRALVGN